MGGWPRAVLVMIVTSLATTACGTRLTHETTGLGVVDGDKLLTVAQADGPNLIAVGDWTGRSVPLHCAASGKVLLAALAEREVLGIVRRGLTSFTERTLVELEPLLEELARVRRRGYATALGEFELGLNKWTIELLLGRVIRALTKQLLA